MAGQRFLGLLQEGLFTKCVHLEEHGLGAACRDGGGEDAAIAIVLIDYIVAYTLLGFGGIFRNKIKNKTVALVLGAVLALTLRYLAHIVSGYIFYGAWAEWFFTQENFYSIGGWILDTFSGKGLSLIYSIFYNGLYMVPEIIITALAAVGVSRIIKKEN